MSELSSPVTSEASVIGVISSLAELAATLSAAHDEQAILSVVMKCVERFAPQKAQLSYLHTDEQGQPAESHTVAIWQDGKVLADSAEYAARRPLDSDPSLRRLVDKRSEVLLFDDGGAPADEGDKALALLRLRGGEGASSWQGVLSLSWQTPHVFSEEERSSYRLLSFGLSMYMSGLHSQRALGEARGEAGLLHEVTKQLNIAMSLDHVMRALTLPAPARDEADVAMCTIDTDPNGQPGWLNVVASLTADGQPSPTAGARYYLPDIPFAKLYLSSPDAPLLISDIETDPRVDEYARKLYAVGGTKATIVMALKLQGRWVGLFNITWRRKVTLGPREQRIYQGLAKQAALLLDNSLMLERLRASVTETQQQGALLRNILDHIPVGVALLDGTTAKPLLGNAYLDRMLGRPLDHNVGGEDAVAVYHFVQPGTERLMVSADTPSQRAIRTRQMEIAEMDILQPAGERVSVESTAVPIVDESGTVKSVIVVLSDLTLRKRAEQDRAKLQEEIIRVQAAALAERSSPLIPITDEILVLPLIGSIDTERGNQVLDTVLHGTSQRGAKVAILDITGVRTVDTQAASALTSAAQALRLLGVEPVLTGIRPEVAQTLIGLGVRLDGIITRSTLQSGIQYALKRLKKSSIA